MLSPVEPYPPASGGAIVIYNDIVHLRERGHELALLANIIAPNADLASMEKVCPTQYFYKYKPPRWRQVVANVGNSLPFTIARYVNERIMEAARQLLREQHFDLILLETVVMGTYGPPLREEFGVPFFIRGHNVDTQILDRFVAEQRNPLLRMAGRWQRRKYAAAEGSILAAADGFSMITETDAAEARRLWPGLEPAVVGAGTDLDFFQPPDQPRDPLLMTDVGGLTEFTKLEALQWFCREVLPLVRQRQPKARLELAGQAPVGRFSAFKGVTVLGRVPDVRPFLHSARVFVAPQFVGSGLRLKILNALATGNAIVCTPVACEGIPLVDGENALIRETPRDFADAVLAVLEDDELAARLGRSGRRLAEEKYAWSAVIAELESQLQQAIDRDRSGTTPSHRPAGT